MQEQFPSMEAAEQYFTCPNCGADRFNIDYIVVTAGIWDYRSISLYTRPPDVICSWDSEHVEDEGQPTHTLESWLCCQGCDHTWNREHHGAVVTLDDDRTDALTRALHLAREDAQDILNDAMDDPIDGEMVTFATRRIAALDAIEQDLFPKEGDNDE